MTKYALLLAAASLSLAACTPPTPQHRGGHFGDMKVIAKLDCPERQGGLERVSAASDGRTCVYDDKAGAEVTLQLVSLEGVDAKTALAPLETRLKGELPPRPAKPVTAADKHDEDRDDVNIDLPGVHIHARGDGGATVDSGNVNVQADDNGARVEVRKPVVVRQDGKTVTVNAGDEHGGVVVDADDNGAEIHIEGAARRGVRMTYILASETPGPNGYRLAGYEARGPKGGPLAVASVKSKVDQRDGLYRDMRALLSKNVGG